MMAEQLDMATIHYGRATASWPGEGHCDSGLYRRNSRSQWLIDSRLKAADALASYEVITFAVSVAVMLGGLLWHSGQFDALIRTVSDLARRLTA